MNKNEGLLNDSEIKAFDCLSVGIAVCIIEDKLKPIYINKELASFWGMKKEDFFTWIKEDLTVAFTEFNLEKTQHAKTINTNRILEVSIKSKKIDSIEIKYMTFVDVSAERQSKEDFDKTAKELKDLVTNLPDGIAVYEVDDEKMKLLYSNCSSNGSIVMLNTKQDYNVITEKDKANFEQTIVQAAKKQEPFLIEYALYSEKGDAIWLSMRGNYTYVGEGKAIYYTSISDITGLKNVNQELLYSEDNLNRTIENLDIVVFDYSIYTNMIKFSKTVEKTFGMKSQVLFKREHYFETGIIYSGDIEHFDNFLSTLKNTNDIGMTYVRMRHLKDTAYYWKKISTTPIVENGEIKRIFGIIENAAKADEFQNVIDYSLANEYDYIAVVDAENAAILMKGDSENVIGLPPNRVLSYSEWIHKIANEYIVAEERENYLMLMDLDKVKSVLSKEDNYEHLYHIYGPSSVVRTKKTRFAYCDNMKKRILITRRDVTADVEKEELIYAGMHDVSTGLYNKVTFVSRCNFAIEESKDFSNYLMLVDINQLKYINDSFGHLFGDEVIKFVAKSLEKHFPDAIIGRFGGDEFEIFMSNITEPKVQAKINALTRTLIYFKPARERGFELGCSYGYTKLVPNDTHKTAFERADNEMYLGKKKIRVNS